MTNNSYSLQARFDRVLGGLKPVSKLTKCLPYSAKQYSFFSFSTTWGRSRGERTLVSLSRCVTPTSQQKRAQQASKQASQPAEESTASQPAEESAASQPAEESADKDTSVGRHNHGKNGITALTRVCAKGVGPIRDVCRRVTPQCLQMQRCLSMSEP